MIEAVISSSVIITIIILIRTVFKGKIKSSVRYFLWLIAAVRLMLPFELIPSPVSVMNAAEHIFPQQEEASAAADTVIPDENEPFIPSEISVSDNVNDTASQVRSAGPRDVLNRIRIFVTAAMLIWFGAVNVLYSITLRRNRRAFEYDSPVRIYTAPDLVSPCIFGLFLPAIYIPEDAAQDSEAVRYITAHELCHYYHGDLIWTVIRYILLSIYWFDPFVWAAAVLSKRDCECACDEAAIKMLGEEKRFAYGKAIIDLIPQKPDESFGVASTSMASSKEVLKERMRFIVKKPVNKISALVFSAAAVILATGSTFTSAQEFSPEKTVFADTSEMSDGRITIAVTDRTDRQQELIYFPAPDGYEPYIYMESCETLEWNYPYHTDDLSAFLDGSHFSAADISFEEKSFTVKKQNAYEAFEKIYDILKQCELNRADDLSPSAPAASISFYRANGGFSSKLDITIYEDKTALITGDDMNRLTDIVIDGTLPTEDELRRAYNNSVHFEAICDGEMLYNMLYELSGQKRNDEADALSYPEFSAASFSENISRRIMVTGKFPQRYVKYEANDIAFGVPFEGSVNEIGKTFLWQDGSCNFRLVSGEIGVPTGAERFSGTFCGKPCSLYETDDAFLLIFSDESGNVFSASAGYANDDERQTARKILGSIHIEGE